MKNLHPLSKVLVEEMWTLRSVEEAWEIASRWLWMATAPAQVEDARVEPLPETWEKTK